MSKFDLCDKVYIKSLGVCGKVCLIMPSGKVFGVRFENEQVKYFRENQLEKFIEPKYRIGQMIYCYPSSYKTMTLMGYKCEIVKASLNKKAKQYSYLAFDGDGYPFAFNEDQVEVVEPKLKIVEMTIKQIEDMFFNSIGKNKNIKLKVIK